MKAGSGLHPDPQRFHRSSGDTIRQGLAPGDARDQGIKVVYPPTDRWVTEPGIFRVPRWHL